MSQPGYEIVRGVTYDPPQNVDLYQHPERQPSTYRPKRAPRCYLANKPADQGTMAFPVTYVCRTAHLRSDQPFQGLVRAMRSNLQRPNRNPGPCCGCLH